MLIVPTTIMRSLAAGAILVGVVSVAAALTLLPALLGAARRRRRPRCASRTWAAARSSATTRRGGSGARSSTAFCAGPALSLVLATGLLLLAAIPAFGLQIGASGVSTLPDRPRVEAGLRGAPAATSRREHRAGVRRRGRRVDGHAAAAARAATKARGRPALRPRRTCASGTARRRSSCPCAATRSRTPPSRPCATSAAGSFPRRSPAATPLCTSAARRRRTSTTSTP